MARLRRIVLPGHPHVVHHSGNNGQTVFHDGVDRANYVAFLRDAAKQNRVAIHAYGLQPAEVRLLATPETEAALADMMQSVGRRFVRVFNQRHGRTGTPWEGRFRSTVIESEPYMLACMRFVEGADATLALDGRHDDSLPRSSAAHHLYGATDPLLVEHASFWALGNTPFEREAAYRAYVAQSPAEAAMATILLATRNGWALGSVQFAGLVGRQSGRRANPVRRGRPKRILTEPTP